MKKLWNWIKGMKLGLVSLWSRGWNFLSKHYICFCLVLLTTVCFLGYTLKLTVDYEKELLIMSNDQKEMMGLIGEQSAALLELDNILQEQGFLVKDQGLLINRLIEMNGRQKNIMIYQDQIIQELTKRLRDLGGLPELPDDGKSRRGPNWISDETI